MIKHAWRIAGVGIFLAAFSPQSFAQSGPYWAGPYIGAFGGYGSGSQGQHDTGIPVAAPPTCPSGSTGTPPDCIPIGSSDGHYNLSGALGGAFIGYNVPLGQFGFAPANPLIIGLEGDIAGSALSGSSATCGTGGVPLHSCGGNIFAMSDIRVRLGLPLGQFMPFVAGGLAVDDIHAYDALFGTSGTRWEAGWTAGAGLEYKITEQFSLRLEYLYQDFGRQTFFDIVPGIPERIRTDANIIRAGFSWSFEPPAPPHAVISKY